jgi:hypothetical protein
MNLRRGLFRLWIVAGILFALGVAVVSYSGIRDEFRVAAWDNSGAATDKWGGYVLLPTACDEVRGNAGTDYSTSESLCWYTIKDFRRLYPEYKDLSNAALSDKLYTKAGRPINHGHPWTALMEAAGVAIGVPLAVLVLGCSLLWAFAGFRGATPAP